MKPGPHIHPRPDRAALEAARGKSIPDVIAPGLEVLFVGMGAYRVAFGRPRARGGRQDERLAGTTIWVLPNPSGRTAGYQMPALARAFRELRRSLSGGTLSGPGR